MNILEGIHYIEEFDDEWIAWGMGGVVLDHDKELKVLFDRKEQWLYIPEKEGETMPLHVEKQYVLDFNSKHKGHGCGGHHYDFEIGGRLKW